MSNAAASAARRGRAITRAVWRSDGENLPLIDAASKGAASRGVGNRGEPWPYRRLDYKEDSLRRRHPSPLVTSRNLASIRRAVPSREHLPRPRLDSQRRRGLPTLSSAVEWIAVPRP